LLKIAAYGKVVLFQKKRYGATFGLLFAPVFTRKEKST
jgi:hypothetical protein